MASYAKITKNKQEDIVLNFQEQEIKIKPYLSTKDKYDLIMITLQKSLDEDIYNPFLLDMYFHLHLVYLYTNISFTEVQKKDEYKIYDTLKTTGFLDMFLKTIPEQEYEELYRTLNETQEKMEKHHRSIRGIIAKIITDLPAQAEAAQAIVDNFDKNKFTEVLKFAQAANGGRPIE